MNQSPGCTSNHVLPLHDVAQPANVLAIVPRLSASHSLGRFGFRQGVEMLARNNGGIIGLGDGKSDQTKASSGSVGARHVVVSFADSVGEANATRGMNDDLRGNTAVAQRGATSSYKRAKATPPPKPPAKKKYKYVSKKKVLTAEEKEKKRQEQILKNRQMSKNSRQRKEQRFAMLEKELSIIQEELKSAKVLGANSTVDTVNEAFGTLLESHEFWNRRDTYNNNGTWPARRVYDPVSGDEVIKFLPSKILENRDGTRKRPFVNPVTAKYQHMQREMWRQEVQENHTALGKGSSSRERNVKNWILSINNTSDMLMKDDIDNLTVLAALSRKDSIHEGSSATSLLEDLRETLRLSPNQVQELKAFEPSIALEVSMWKRIFEMQSRIEATVAMCIPALRKVEKQFEDAFLHDDLLVKLFRLVQANMDGIRYLDLTARVNADDASKRQVQADQLIRIPDS